MKHTFSLITITLLVFTIFTNCQKDSDNSVDAIEDDQFSIQELANSEDEELFYELGIDDKDESNMFDGYSSFDGDLGKITAPIDSVLRFGRRIEDRGLRRLEIQRIAPDTFKVSIEREFGGVFVIFEKGEDTTGTRPIIIHRKRLRHVVRRNAIFVKRVNVDAPVDLSDRHHRGWKLAAVSADEGHSVPTHTLQINEVAITSASGESIVITNPLRHFFYSREELPTFVHGDSVTVQVKLTNTTANPVDPEGNGSTETLLLHFGANRHHHARKRFHFVGIDPATGDHVYEGSWKVRQHPGHVFHVIIDAIDNGTIYDSDADTFPYNSATVGAPYRVVEAG